ncbi:3 beta-hydroxysteroid dehydrogenase/Delta 5--_4-isomerase [Gemmata obscuriglobus]|uniref:NAD-dependent epimerase/dehydratase domain-containing protein n=1 Tax=Gemmata obscuriglobus TaxID=114 RepID=A0A2Z3GY93_9BACT|nr:NAD-dependent epimerase/dehydratase family protein [Gemmata obscuriglobus]AWM38398.1 hypothetical protein C1280_16300 [Gemmata obscuriglobus]QEG28681.1 3 beta-hydroxysteroid dehydrogenase/Delta 5-->4-isomerase [Gemmata obscuriglobus]VTS06926.1 nad-dependent epimerase dehydratase : Uncharacterized protein OS=Thermoactinomyces sp. Gus2-1 GN=JS81_03245 PE=4 SV=1: Epimerase [Gemmata obscuriglobus UQM 2246]
MTASVETLHSTESFWSGCRACVLGGNGFLGRHIVAALLARGARVRTLSLPGPPDDSHPELETRTGDVTDRAAVRDAMAGARVVFLAAGPVGGGRHAAGVMNAHTAAVDCVLDELPTNARLVLTSSVVAVGAGHGAVLTEDSVFPNSNLKVGYVRAKRAAEDRALAAARRRDLVVVNPGYLFGPNDPGPSVMGRLCVRFWRGNLLLPPPGGINVVDVRDVAVGHLLAAEHGAAGRRYILGGANVTFAELFAGLARAAGLRRAVLPGFRPALPGPALWLLGALGELGARVTGKPSDVSLELARLFRLKWFASSARAEAELGFRVRPLADTLADAFAWHAGRTRVAPRGLNRLWLRTDRSAVPRGPDVAV